MRRRKLKNLHVTHVSYVDRGANQKVFYLTKEYEEKKQEPDFQANVRLICSEDEEERKVYGIVYMPDVVDAHGDYADAKTIEKAAHEYLENYQKMDTQHNLNEGSGKPIESYLAPVDFDVNGEHITKGTWILASKATPEVWEKIKKGEITGYSLYGTAETEYEKVSLIDFVSQLFKSKDGKVQINNMEVVMDEELKKALETINKTDGAIQELLKSLSKESLEILLKSIFGDLVKKAIEDISTSEVVKANDTKMESINTSVANLSKKIDDVIEALQNGTYKETPPKDEPTTTTTYKSSIM